MGDQSYLHLMTMPSSLKANSRPTTFQHPVDTATRRPVFRTPEEEPDQQMTSDEDGNHEDDVGEFSDASGSSATTGADTLHPLRAETKSFEEKRISSANEKEPSFADWFGLNLTQAPLFERVTSLTFHNNRTISFVDNNGTVYPDIRLPTTPISPANAQKSQATEGTDDQNLQSATTTGFPNAQQLPTVRDFLPPLPPLPNFEVPRPLQQAPSQAAGLSNAPSNQLVHRRGARLQRNQPNHWKNWHLKYYFVYPNRPYYSRGEEVEYYIQGSAQDISAENTSFRSIVRNPLGELCDVLIRVDARHKHRYLCSYFAEIPGIYNCTVQLRNRGMIHVEGSPFQTKVSRDYTEIREVAVGRIPHRYSDRPNQGWRICVEPETGKIFVINPTTHQIHIASMSGEILKTFGGMGSEHGRLNAPSGIAMDAVNQRILVTDKNNHRISSFNLDGSYDRSYCFCGRGDGRLFYPRGIAVSPNGAYIAVADHGSNRIQLFDKHGKFLKRHLLSLDPRCAVNEYFVEDLEPSCALCFDKNGKLLYFTDETRRLIFAINLEFTEKCIFTPPGNLEGTGGITVDGTGNIVICDTPKSLIRIMTSNGFLMTVIETVLSPLDVVVLKSGELLIMDVVGTMRRI